MSNSTSMLQPPQAVLIMAAAMIVCTTALDSPLAAGREAAEESTNSTIHSVALQKQYVPIMKNGKTIAYKTAYYGTIFAGSDLSQSFTVVFDTGSGHIILPSTSCHSETCSKHRRYSRLLSPSVVDIEYDGRELDKSAVQRDQIGISFGTGQVLGEFVKEDICLGTSACVSLHVVLALEMTPDPFGMFAFDGVMGLGLNALTINDKFSFFGQMVEQRPEMHARFAVFMSKTEGVDSIISFGGHEERLATSPFQYVPVARQEQGYWQVQIKSVRIGDRVLEECADGQCHAILDTGTSLLGVPKGLATSMHRRLARPVPQEAQSDPSKIDCRTLPGEMMHFDLGDTVVSLGVEDYSRPKPVNMTTKPENVSMSSQETSWMLLCRSLLLPVAHPDPVGPMTFIWGEPVLRRYYTVYDLATKKIGFTLAGQPAARSTSGSPSEITAPPAGSLLPGAPLPALSISTGGETAQVV